MKRISLFLILLFVLSSTQRALAQCEHYPGFPDVNCELASGLDEDPEAISPPELVPPVFECSDRVPLRSFVRGATVRVYHRDSTSGAVTLWGSGIGTVPWGQTVIGSGGLSEGDVLWATQQMPGGPESDPSPEITAQLLGQATAPVIDPVPVYECGRVIALRDVPVGSTATVEHDELGTLMNGPASSGWTGVVIAPLPTHAALSPSLNVMTGQYDLCGQVGGPSEPESIWPEPSDLQAPELAGSAIYEGQEYVVVHGTAFGSTISLRTDNLGNVGNGVNFWGVDDRAEPIELTASPAPGDVMYPMYSLCNESPEPDGTPVLACSDLPPPRFRVPQVGDSHVWIEEAVPGARILVFAEGAGGTHEIGDATTDGQPGSSIRLSRAVQLNETIRVVQRIGECQSEYATFYHVACRRIQSLPFIQPGAHDVGTADFELGTTGEGWRISGRTYFPTNVELAPNEVIPYGGRLPSIFIMHGQRSSHRCSFGTEICPEVGDCLGSLCARAAEEMCSVFDASMYPEIRSFEGYGVAAERLASHGFVVVSINANDVCNGGTANINERISLFRSHFMSWFESDYSSNPDVGHLMGRLDPARVVVAGHSRGGEAAVIAGNEPGVDISVRGILAVAPSTLNLGTSSNSKPIVVAIGTRDGDTGVSGQRIYDQSSQADWRSAHYVRGANHNNWNSVWGNDDASGAGGMDPLTDTAQEQLLAQLLFAAAQQFLALTPPSDGSGLSAWLTGGASLGSYSISTVYGNRDDLTWNGYSGTGSNALGGSSMLTGFYDVEAAECRLGADLQPEAFMGKSAAVWARWEGENPVIEEELPGGIADSTYSWVSIRFSQVPLLDRADSMPPISVAISATDDTGAAHPVPLESAVSQVPPIYGFDYPHGLPDENGVAWEPEAFGQWGSIRIPLACVIGGDGVPNGDSLRAMSFQLGDEEGWVTVDDLVFQ